MQFLKQLLHAARVFDKMYCPQTTVFMEIDPLIVKYIGKLLNLNEIDHHNDFIY